LKLLVKKTKMMLKIREWGVKMRMLHQRQVRTSLMKS